METTGTTARFGIGLVRKPIELTDGTSLTAPSPHARTAARGPLAGRGAGLLKRLGPPLNGLSAEHDRRAPGKHGGGKKLHGSRVSGLDDGRG